MTKGIIDNHTYKKSFFNSKFSIATISLLAMAADVISIYVCLNPFFINSAAILTYILTFTAVFIIDVFPLYYGTALNKIDKNLHEQNKRDSILHIVMLSVAVVACILVIVGIFYVRSIGKDFIFRDLVEAYPDLSPQIVSALTILMNLLNIGTTFSVLFIGIITAKSFSEEEESIDHAIELEEIELQNEIDELNNAIAFDFHEYEEKIKKAYIAKLLELKEYAMTQAREDLMIYLKDPDVDIQIVRNTSTIQTIPLTNFSNFKEF